MRGLGQTTAHLGLGRESFRALVHSEHRERDTRLDMAYVLILDIASPLTDHGRLTHRRGGQQLAAMKLLRRAICAPHSSEESVSFVCCFGETRMTSPCLPPVACSARHARQSVLTTPQFPTTFDADGNVCPSMTENDKITVGVGMAVCEFQNIRVAGWRWLT